LYERPRFGGHDNENVIPLFIGRNTSATGEVVGVDAALDFPLFFILPGVRKQPKGSVNNLTDLSLSNEGRSMGHTNIRVS